MRMVSGLILLLVCATARAEIACDQLGVIAQATITLRDQRVSLSALLADAERGDMKARFTAQELDFIKRVIRESFNGSLSPIEVVEACRDGALPISQPPR